MSTSTVLESPNFIPSVPALAERDFLEVMTSRHRSQDGVVVFLRNDQGTMRTLGGCGVAETHEHHDWLRDALHVDGYFTINGVWGGNGGKPVRNSPLRRYRRKKKHIEYLNASYVDLDVDHLGIAPDEGLDRAFQLLNEHALPWPAWVVFSGSGLWLLWQFEESVRTSPRGDERHLLERLNRKIQQLFRDLGADPNAVDCSRVMRVPGSLNSKANRRVRFFRVEAAPRLSFQELLRTFNVPAEPTSFGPQAEKPGKRYPLRARGALAGWANRLAIFKHFEGRPIQKGRRHYVVAVRAYLMLMNREPETEILRECSRLAQSCQPPLDSSELPRCLALAKRMRADRVNFDYATLARLLNVPLEEWNRCYIRVCCKSRISRSPLLQQSKNVTVRRNLVHELSMQGLSVREIAKALEQRGIRGSYVTVFRDLHAGPPRKAPQKLDGTAPVANEFAKSGCVTLGGVRDFGEFESGCADANIVSLVSRIPATIGLRSIRGGA